VIKILTGTSLYILEVLSYSKKHNIYTTKNSDLYEYDTRRRENHHVQSYNTLTCEKGVVNMAIKLHNKLPMELRKGKRERKFKHRLKRYLLEHPYYTLQEFLSEVQ
jgi:hypothetical protein